MKMISNLKMRINLFSMRVGQSKIHHGGLVFISVRLEITAVKGVKQIKSMINAARNDFYLSENF